MEYQKIVNLSESTPNQTSKFTTKRSSFYDYSDAYVLVSATITVSNRAASSANIRKNIIKNCTPFTNCVSEINNTKIDNAKDIDIVMRMYNLE